MYRRYSNFELTGIPVLLFSLSCITFVMRCWIKKMVIKKFSLDDWLMLITMVFHVAGFTVMLELIHSGFGKSAYELELWQIQECFKFFSISVILLVLISISVKLSIAFLLLRLTVAQPFQRMIIIGNTVFNTVVALAFGFFFVFECHPVQYHWDWSIKNGSCVGKRVNMIAMYAYSTTCLITDLVYALVPIWMIRGIQMDKRTKISVCIILGLGILASSTNIARMKFLKDIASSTDVLAIMSYPVVTCTGSEICIGIVAANMATLRPLLRKLVEWGGSAKSVLLQRSPKNSEEKNSKEPSG